MRVGNHVLLFAAVAMTACSEYDLQGFNEPADLDDDLPDEMVPGEPVADAGVDVFTAPLVNVELDGTLSWDPTELDIIGWEWTLVSQPEGSTSTNRQQLPP